MGIYPNSWHCNCVQVDKRPRKTRAQQFPAHRVFVLCGLWPCSSKGPWCHVVHHSILLILSVIYQCFTASLHILMPGFLMCLAHSICWPSLGLFYLLDPLSWCPAIVYQPQTSHPAKQSWQKHGFLAAGLARLPGSCCQWSAIPFSNKRGWWYYL